jgi:hypothetical protein
VSQANGPPVQTPEREDQECWGIMDASTSGQDGGVTGTRFSLLP